MWCSVLQTHRLHHCVRLGVLRCRWRNYWSCYFHLYHKRKSLYIISPAKAKYIISHTISNIKKELKLTQTLFEPVLDSIFEEYQLFFYNQRCIINQHIFSRNRLTTRTHKYNRNSLLCFQLN